MKAPAVNANIVPMAGDPAEASAVLHRQGHNSSQVPTGLSIRANFK